MGSVFAFARQKHSNNNTQHSNNTFLSVDIHLYPVLLSRFLYLLPFYMPNNNLVSNPCLLLPSNYFLDIQQRKHVYKQKGDFGEQEILTFIIDLTQPYHV